MCNTQELAGSVFAVSCHAGARTCTLSSRRTTSSRWRRKRSSLAKELTKNDLPSAFADVSRGTAATASFVTSGCPEHAQSSTTKGDVQISLMQEILSQPSKLELCDPSSPSSLNGHTRACADRSRLAWTKELPRSMQGLSVGVRVVSGPSSASFDLRLCGVITDEATRSIDGCSPSLSWLSLGKTSCWSSAEALRLYPLVKLVEEKSTESCVHVLVADEAI
mmetsp:Transcript_29664/g.78641  ORF Transcript_29664/g.78641 Transcript_29664/m.78641 type:complete len:221 (+) Transcript_29664:573-1235(+)